MSKAKNKDDLTEFMNAMKNELLDQIKKGNEDLEKKITTANKNLEDSLKAEISGIKEDVKQNTKDIEKITKRLEEIEESKKKDEAVNTFAQALKLPPKPQEVKTKTKENYIEAAKKVIGLFPVTDGDIKYFMDKGLAKEDAIL